MDIKYEFSLRLKRSIDDKWHNIRQKDCCSRLNISQSVLSDWLSGKKMPGTEKLIEISIILDVSFEWLATGRGEKLAHKNQTDHNIDMRKKLDEIDRIIAELKN